MGTRDRMRTRDRIRRKKETDRTVSNREGKSSGRERDRMKTGERKRRKTETETDGNSQKQRRGRAVAKYSETKPTVSITPLTPSSLTLLTTTR